MRRLILISVLTLVVAVPSWAQEKPQEEPDHANESLPFDGGENNSEYFLLKSDEAFHRGDYERAVLLHRARVAIDPEAVDSFGVGAWLLWSMGRAGEAAEFLERGIKTNPDDWEMWNEAGQQYDLQKRLVRAEECYKRAVELLPKEESSQMLRRRLAHASEKAGDLPLAVQTWRGLVKDFSTEAVNKNNLRRVENLIAELDAERARKAAALPK